MTRRPSLPCRGRRMRTVLLAVLQLVLFIAVPSAAKAHAATLSGVVLDENGSSVEGAAVSVWLGDDLIASGRTGSDGSFDIDVEADTRYAVYVFADDDSTSGVDYLPSRAEAEPPEGGELRLTLVSAASLVFEGDIQFVESEELPLSVVYVVSDPASDGAMNISGFSLRYGSTPDVQSAFLGLETSHLIVPAGAPFSVDVNCSLIIGNWLVSRSFKVDGPGHFPLGRGERVAVDVRLYSVPFNLDLVEALHRRVELKIGDMEMVGFYLTAERGAAASAARQISEARYLYDEGRHIESFDAAKRSYIALRQIMTDLTGMYGDAALSVYILIALLSFSSTTIAFLLSNRNSTKLLSCPALYAVSLAVLYLTYPGSGIIPLELFTASAALALLSSLAVASILPRFLRGRGRDSHLPVRNIIAPIFSIAKRGIRRRRLRFALTLTSLTVLVMSFVALTSFSQGYGLIVSRVSGRGAPVTGVMLRAPGYTEEAPAFMTQTDIESSWLERQPESRVISPKAENFPVAHTVATLNGTPIYGVVGVDPDVESAVIDLAGVLREGALPSEEGILISEALRRRLGVEVGDCLALGDIRVTLLGVFDDEAFRRLRDLDGSAYLPRKLVNLSPEGETPTLVLASCDTSEIVVAHLLTALRMPSVGVARVDIAVKEGIDVNAFAERLALERGYGAWSSSPDGVYFARLGGYLEGKGLPLMVPWAIVILNVLVTMLNSMYERRREIHILSSVGLNPAQIAAIFVAEASIIGIVAGGVGYLAGLSLYRAMAFFKLALEVHQKISAFWCLASIGIAMTAVITGALAALRSSVIITPSLMRRWRFEKERGVFEPWEVSIPVKLIPEEVETFVDFVVRALKARERSLLKMTSSIRVSTEAEGTVQHIDFVYRDAQPGGRFYTKNTLLIERRTDMEVAVRLRSYSDEASAHITGSLVRLIAMQWSTMRGRSAASRGS